MVHVPYLMPLFPLAGFVALALAGRRIGERWSGVIGTGSVAASFAVAVVVVIGLQLQPASAREITQTYFTWIPVGGLQVKVASLVDPLSMTMCLFVTGVSMLIHLYATGYMRADRDVPKFFAYFNLFVFFMLVLVLANNLLVTFVGWEGVGLCSYLLVAYWYERTTAASAGKKAFIYNRVGDAGFLIAVFLIFSKVGSLNYLQIFAHKSLLSGGTAAVAVLLLFLGATGKSAQIPLFNWLPDAMEGPTPVSALIHAATMVTAGVYLMCRVNPLLNLSSNAMTVVAVIGGVTAFVAATIASAQQDIKKALAFSTVSQIGYMMLAVGTGAYIAAIFLMVAHAFYKALLFLGAGSVIHGLENEQDMKRMGGLRLLMPWTYATFLVAWLAIAGIPPLSGFWSKSDVLTNVFSRTPALYGLGIATAFLTAYYMSRLFFLSFTGDPRWSRATGGRPPHHPPHECPWVMRLPLVVLAVCAFAGGVFDLPWVHHYGFQSWLAPVFAGTLYRPTEGVPAQWVLAVVDAGMALLGLAVAWRLWHLRAERPELEPPFLQRVWYWDDAYDTFIGRPGQRLARFSMAVVENRVIDGAVNAVARLVREAASGTRRVQSGFVRNYALAIFLGVAAIIAFMVSRVFGS